MHPRTPVQWPAGACIEVVERSGDPVLHLDYAVAADDTMVTIDELPDSRTHQFLAFDRHHPPGEPLPRYLSESDLQRAIDAGLEDAEVQGTGVVIDTDPLWGPAMTRITGDDMRVPITVEQAAMGVDWDTSGVAEGAYFVAGYTWEPKLNLWSPRDAVVLVVDELGPTSPPAAAMPGLFELVDTLVTVGEPFEVRACARAMAGSQAVFEWRPTESAGAQWTSFATRSLDATDIIELSASFDAPPETRGTSVDLRVRVEDTQGREVIAYARRELMVINDGAGETGDTGDTGETGGEAEGGGGGCRMGAVNDQPGLPLLAGWLWLLRRRRVLRQASTPA